MGVGLMVHCSLMWGIAIALFFGREPLLLLFTSEDSPSSGRKILDASSTPHQCGMVSAGWVAGYARRK